MRRLSDLKADIDKIKKLKALQQKATEELAKIGADASRPVKKKKAAARPAVKKNTAVKPAIKKKSPVARKPIVKKKTKPVVKSKAKPPRKKAETPARRRPLLMAFFRRK